MTLDRYRMHLAGAWRPLAVCAWLMAGALSVSSDAAPTADAPQAYIPIKSLAGAPAGTYKIDPDHAYLTFQFDHLGGLSRPTFRFRKMEAEYVWDPAHPEATSLEVRVMPTYIDTGNAQFDVRMNASDILRGFDFGEYGKYRYITFTSTQIRFAADGKGELTGDLTFLGVTRPITINFSYNGFLNYRGLSKMGFAGTGSLKRSDFGMTSVPEAGDMVNFTMDLEFMRDDPAARDYIKNRRDDPRG